MTAKPVVLAVTSDHHIRSTVGLCPPQGCPLDDGGTYMPSKAQQWLWQSWVAFWGQVDKVRREEGADLYEIYNGDLIDGEHHGTPQISTKNLADEQELALACLAPALSLAPNYVFVVRGTEAHVGKSGEREEMIARRIEAEKDPQGNASWWQLTLQINGSILQFAHHGRIGYRPWTRANAAQMLAAELTIDHSSSPYAPQLAVFSHHHQVADSYDNYPVRVIQTPAWQLATAYVHRIKPGALASIGGLVIICREGEYSVEKVIYKPEREKPWTESPYQKGS